MASIHDLLESIQGLQGYAKDLEYASRFGDSVPMRAEDLRAIASFLEGVAEEIQSLIPDLPIDIKKASPEDRGGFP